MTEYKLEKNTKERKLGKKKIMIDGFQMNPKFKNHQSLVNVEEIIIANPTLKEKALKMQFNIAFRKALRMVMDTVEEGGDEGLALNEIVRMKKILKEKYEQEVSTAEFHRMWQKIELLESDLKRKLVEKRRMEELYFRQMMENQEREEERGRGR